MDCGNEFLKNLFSMALVTWWHSFSATANRPRNFSHKRNSANNCLNQDVQDEKMNRISWCSSIPMILNQKSRRDDMIIERKLLLFLPDKWQICHKSKTLKG
jgi:hypothetical protein